MLSGFATPLLAVVLLLDNGSVTVLQPQADNTQPTWVVAAKHFRPFEQEGRRPESRQIVILGPSCTCFGRFSDSLKERMLDPHDWIQGVQVEHGFGFPKPLADGKILDINSPSFPLGDPTRITFWTDASVSDQQLVDALKKSRAYDLTSWKIQQWVPLDSVETVK